jgi:hypothetical protein
MINLYLLEDAYGFGNKILMWDAWFHFLSKQNEDFTIFVCVRRQFPEMKFFNYPKTKDGCSGYEYKGRKQPLKNIEIDMTINIDKGCLCGRKPIELKELSTHTKNKIKPGNYIAIDGMEFNSDFYLETSKYDGASGYHSYFRKLQKIKVKDENYFNEIKNRLKEVVGIHVRRGDVHNDGLGHFKELEFYTNIMDKIIKYNSNQEFYLSTDGEYEEVKYLHDNYNIITSEDFGYKPHYRFMRYPMKFPKFSMPDLTDILSLRSCMALIPSHSTWSDVCIYWDSVYRLENLNQVEVLFNDKLLDDKGLPYGSTDRVRDWVNLNERI